MNSAKILKINWSKKQYLSARYPLKTYLCLGTDDLFASELKIYFSSEFYWKISNNVGLLFPKFYFHIDLPIKEIEKKVPLEPIYRTME